MEPKAEYVTRAAIVEKKVHRCDACKNVYGYENSNGYLVVGELIQTIFRGWCAKCGATIKYYSTDARMERMIRGRKRKQ